MSIEEYIPTVFVSDIFLRDFVVSQTMGYLVYLGITIPVFGKISASVFTGFLARLGFGFGMAAGLAVYCIFALVFSYAWKKTLTHCSNRRIGHRY